MKQILYSFVVLFVCVPSFAQLMQGQHMVGGRLGLGFQLVNSGISYTDSDRVDWGTLGAEYGLSYYYLVTEHIGLGAEVSYGDFEGGDFFVSSDKVDDRTKLVNTMLSMRLTANPSNLFRLYIPLGAGLTTAQQKLHIRRSGVDCDHTATDTSFGWFFGAGLEFDIGRDSGWSMGLEGRCNTFHYNTDKLIRDAPDAVKGDGNRRLSYMSFHLRIDKRF